MTDEEINWWRQVLTHGCSQVLGTDVEVDVDERGLFGLGIPRASGVYWHWFEITEVTDLLPSGWECDEDGNVALDEDGNEILINWKGERIPPHSVRT